MYFFPFYLSGKICISSSYRLDRLFQPIFQPFFAIFAIFEPFTLSINYTGVFFITDIFVDGKLFTGFFHYFCPHN